MELDDQYSEKRSIAQYVQYLSPYVYRPSEEPEFWGRRGNKIRNGEVELGRGKRDTTLIYSH